MTKQIEAAIKIAADNIGALRCCDVFRVIEWAQPALRGRLAAFITSNRPDLAAEVADVMTEF